MTTSNLEAAAASTVDEGLAACRMLDELMTGRLAGCFARAEPRRQARKYVTGLISELPRKNCWALAEQAGDATPDKMQRLLERAAWDAAGAMAAVREFAVSYLGDPAGAVLVIDESGQEKAGCRTAGVKRQYLGCAGRVANGINVVYASYAAPAGRAVVGARLYVPADWAGDRDRRLAAGIPEDLEFATKPQLAAGIITDLLAEGRCPPWVTGDEVYGRDARLRPFLEDQGSGYVLKIPCSFRVTLPTGQKMRADHAARVVPAAAWQTASAGHGPKGERDYRSRPERESRQVRSYSRRWSPSHPTERDVRRDCPKQARHGKRGGAPGQLGGPSERAGRSLTRCMVPGGRNSGSSSA